MANTDIILFEPQKVGIIAQVAPQAYKENSVSHDRCIDAGSELLERAKSEGMSDALDQDIALFIERAKRTVKKMNGKRSAVTQLFDTIRSAYTTLENEVDPTKKGTVPAQLQEMRNRYAAKKREEQEAELRKKQMEQALAAAKSKYATDVESDLLRLFNARVALTYNRMVELAKSLTIENYEDVFCNIKSTSDKLPQEWFDMVCPEVLLPAILSPEEACTIINEVKQKMHQRFTEQFAFEISTNRDDILDRLPSKRNELERIAKANKEEAERIKKQMEERERAEAERRAKEKAEQEAKEKAAAELAAQKQEMEDLFGKAEIQQADQYIPKTSVKKSIRVLNSEGFMQIVGMWWAQHGCTLSVEELEKEFKKQLTFCNKLANDKKNPVFIRSEHIEYVDDVKAK